MRASQAEGVAVRVAESYGRSIIEQIAADISASSPTALFQLLCVCVLARPRVPGWTALSAAGAMREEGWRSPEHLAASPWKGRVLVLSRAGYERSPERMALTIGTLAGELRDLYDGDLWNLREEADRNPPTERSLLKGLKGVDDRAVDVFFREVQGFWDELYPFADERVLRAARRIGLPDDPLALAELVERSRFTRLTAALAHIDRSDAYAALARGVPSAVDLREVRARQHTP